MKLKLMRRVLPVLLSFLFLFQNSLPILAEQPAEWSPSPELKIYWVETPDSDIWDNDLKEQIQLFSQELAGAGILDEAPPVIYGQEKDAGQTDILLVLDSAFEIPDEGYEISISENNQLQIRASDRDGLFYGCRRLEQDVLSGTALYAGTEYCDSPDTAERAFFLDCGRKYYSPEWIIDIIKEISWSNLNAIYLHFSDEMGFRLESKTYPWLAGADHTLCVAGSSAGAAADDGKYLTQEDMRQIAEAAARYHVEIIPSLDSPGHMNYSVKKYMEHCGTDIGNYFHYDGKTSIVQGSGPEEQQKMYSRGIDISNSEAVEFAQNLYSEFAAFFKELGCTKFDIGGDELLGWGTAVTSSVPRWKQLDHWKEYAAERAHAEGKEDYEKASAYDGFLYYMNDIYELVSSFGYTSVRMWNDDALRTSDTGYTGVVRLNPEIEIQYWTDSANNGKNSIWTYLNAGFQAYNFSNSYNYYVLGDEHTEEGSGGYEGCTPQRIYENWNPYVFAPFGSANPGRNTSVGNPNVKGSAFCVWADNPSAETALQIKENLLPLLRAYGAKTWDVRAEETADYRTFSGRCTAIGGVPAQLPAAAEVVDTMIGEENCLLSFGAQSRQAFEGKKFILIVHSPAAVDIDRYEIVDETGARVEIERLTWAKYNRNYPNRQSAKLIVPASVKGEHIYTVYAVTSDGLRSPDSKSITLTVK